MPHLILTTYNMMQSMCKMRELGGEHHLSLVSVSIIVILCCKTFAIREPLRLRCAIYQVFNLAR